jgi:hypothetical protein
MPVLPGISIQDAGKDGSVSVHSTEQSKVVKRHQDVADATRSLMQHFNDRLTLDNLRLSERYLNGELHIIVYFRFGENIKYAVSFERETRRTRLQKKSGVIAFGDVTEDSGELIPDFGDFSRGHTMEPILPSESEQQTVLVDNVQAMDMSKHLPVSTRVRFDLRERFYSVRRQTLSYGPNTGFKFTGALTCREIDILKRAGRIGSDANKTICQMIQSAPQVVNGISCNERDISPDGLNVSKIVHAVRSIRCVLREDWIRIVLDEFTPKLSEFEDVFFGPF